MAQPCWHEVLQYRDNGLDDEVWYAMLQPRYRQALPRIEKFMARPGCVHVCVCCVV